MAAIAAYTVALMARGMGEAQRETSMGLMTGDRRRGRLIVLGIFAVALAALGGMLVAIAVADRERAMEMATSHAAQGEPQETELDAFQVPPYVVALGVCLAMIFVVRKRADRLPLWIFLAALTAWLLCRELPFDEQVLRANAFSWAKYLHDDHVPRGVRIGFAVVTMGLTLALMIYGLVRRRAVRALVREKFLSLSSVLIVLSGVLLFGAQTLDKHRSTDHVLDTHLSRWALRDYCEESLELVGAVLLLMACLMAVLEEPRPEPPGPLAPKGPPPEA